MAEVNFSTMTDEEFVKYSMSNDESEQTVETKQSDVTNDIEDTESETTELDTDTQTDEQDTGDTDTDDNDEEESQQQQNENNSNETEDTETNDTAETSEIDYKAFYEQVTSDYKANGKMMPGLKNPEDFKTALAMASNYALKMAALKPHLAKIKTLEKLGVTDEEFNEMLELRARNPEAIKKVLKEANIDPLDIDINEESNYRPQNHIISQAELEYENIISSIKDTPEFATTVKVVTEVWDETSRRAMFENPKLIKGLNEEIQMGRFDYIQSLIEQRKLLGKDNGMSDLEMYREIATAMDMQQQQQQQVATPKMTTPTPKVENPAIIQQKKQAGISTKKTSNAVKKYDPARLSDDEFMALVQAGAKFIN